MHATPLLCLRNVAKSYSAPEGRVRVLDGVDLTLDRGETLSLTGESGSGKSTLLHLIAGLDAVDSGEIRLGAVDVAQLDEAARARMRRRELGLVFQQFNLIPSLTVADNIAFQARIAERRAPDWERKLTSRLGLEGLEGRYPEQLSGGQQQRVAIARALAPRPPLILADEPTGNLDEAASESVVALLVELAASAGAGVLMATHSEKLASALSRRVHLARGCFEEANDG